MNITNFTSVFCTMATMYLYATIGISLLIPSPIKAFSLQPPPITSIGVKRQSFVHLSPLHARYGPVDNGDSFNNNNRNDKDNSNESTETLEASQRMQQRVQGFRNLIEQIQAVPDPQHIPSLLTRNLDLLLDLSGSAGAKAAEIILQEVQSSQDEATASRTVEVMDLVLTFTEDFVEEALRIDKQNKELLGKIIKLIANKETSAKDREEGLDRLLQAEQKSCTPGFLRHVEGECQRIASAPRMTPESARLLEILRVIQARVVEELGKDLGEAAQVLGQLIGYESKAERLAVLEAGLQVRGVSFAKEMAALTEEALEGFRRVSTRPDPDLVESVQDIDQRLREFIEEMGVFQ
jgi:hypothetical protein